MCGIVGIASKSDCVNGIIAGLYALEYRGYDSSGIATLHDNFFANKKSIGKISRLENETIKDKISGNLGIGHTRWATHGKPTLNNCHPFIKNNCALVHNGIIENFEELLKTFEINESCIKSETDTEIIAEICDKLLNQFNNPIDAIKKVSQNIEGTFSFAFLIKGSDSIYATRRGSPLVLGLSENFNSISSDVLGLPEGTKEIIFLEESDIAMINSSSISIYNIEGNIVNRKKHEFLSKKDFKIKGKFKHFMEKEIFHQPISLEDTILNFADKKTNSVFLPKNTIDFNNISNVILVACGTAYHSCMIAKYWFEQMTDKHVSIDIASEYRYKKNNFDKNSIAIVVSQSGETMDTLECLKKFRQKDLFTISIVNVLNSSIARMSDYVLPTLAGPEIGVAATKSFTAQLVVLALLGLHIQQQKNNIEKNIFNSLFSIHETIKKILKDFRRFEEIAHILKDAKSIFYIGRGIMYPIALEGALKLKEITYKHCEGYAAGELKHGPLALIEDQIPVIALAPSDHNFFKMLSNIQEVRARGGKSIIITDKEGSIKAQKYCDQIIVLPNTNYLTSAIIYSLPIQLIAYHLAVLLGTDVDQPRNLAKSVTVE
ncbi:glutamine--fructose-6-phosphate transaminase (isomerizing) [Alphaproteobacteria bacterium]|nr:glutamine--fructose-6-phosphate transaminase (isomerizing) [Alphaproteobacteria bacterium]